jgi:adenine C2-methylase RlmN of 23S rRNA A2503 and tRNA A37
MKTKILLAEDDINLGFLIKEILEKNGINQTVRRRMGADIDAACGQLRRKRTPG